MPIQVNLRHLEDHNVRLEGELGLDELDIETRDEVIRLAQPLTYDIELQRLEGGLLVRGSLRLPLDCQCVRCLKPFSYVLDLNDWNSHVPLEGEDAAVVQNDCVDLTPYVREDILLAFPQHPLCDPGCGGLPEAKSEKLSDAGETGQSPGDSSAWAELNKLKF